MSTALKSFTKGKNNSFSQLLLWIYGFLTGADQLTLWQNIATQAGTQRLDAVDS